MFFKFWEKKKCAAEQIVVSGNIIHQSWKENAAEWKDIASQWRKSSDDWKNIAKGRIDIIFKFIEEQPSKQEMINIYNDYCESEGSED